VVRAGSTRYFYALKVAFRATPITTGKERRKSMDIITWIVTLAGAAFLTVCFMQIMEVLER
jgi:hypothetical protein